MREDAVEVVLGASEGTQVARGWRARLLACLCALSAASCAPEPQVESEAVCRVWAPAERAEGELMVGGTGAALGLMEALGEGWAQGVGDGARVRVPASLGRMTMSNAPPMNPGRSLLGRSRRTSVLR